MAANGRFLAGLELFLDDKLTAPLKKILGNIFGLEKAAEKAAKAFKFSANAKQAADGMKGFADGMVNAVGAPIKKMMEFEDIMAKVRANTFNGKVTAETTAEFQKMGDFAREMGAKTKFSGVESAEGMDILATAGFDAKAQMAALPGILDLAAASNESIADSADIAASAMSQFGLEAKDMGMLGDVIAKTAQSSQVGLKDMGEAAKYAGVSAKNAGVGFAEFAASVGVLGDVGVRGSAAGTTLRSMFSSLQAPSKKAKSALAFLGLNTKDKQGNMRPFNEILKEMDSAMDKKFGKGKGGNRRANLLKGLFDEASAANASLLIAKAGAGDLDKKIQENLGSSGTAAKVAADMGNSTAGSARELSSAFEELQLKLGEVLIPTVREFIDLCKNTIESVSGWAKEHPTLTKYLGIGAAAVGVLAIGVWGVVTAVGAASTAFGALTLVCGYAAKAFLFVDKVLKFLKVGFLTNPITLIMMGIVTVALLVIEYWEPIKAFFGDLWEGIKNVFKSVWDWIVGKIEWVGDKINWLKENLLGMEAEVDWGDIDKEYAQKVGKMNKEELILASKSDDAKLATAANNVIRMVTKGRGFDEPPPPTAEQVAAAKAQASQIMSGIFKVEPASAAANDSPELAAAKAAMGGEVPTMDGLPAGMPAGMPDLSAMPAIMPNLGGGLMKAELTIHIKGQTESTSLVNNNPGFAVKVNTGTQ